MRRLVQALLQRQKVATFCESVPMALFATLPASTARENHGSNAPATHATPPVHKVLRRFVAAGRGVEKARGARVSCASSLYHSTTRILRWIMIEVFMSCRDTHTARARRRVRLVAHLEHPCVLPLSAAGWIPTAVLADQALSRAPRLVLQWNRGAFLTSSPRVTTYDHLDSNACSFNFA